MTDGKVEGLAHVLMTADAVGGVWTYALTMARELSRRGVRVTLAMLGPEPTPDQLRLAGEAGAGCVVLGGALDWTAAGPGEIDLAGMRLAALASRLRPDILHLNSPALGANARFPSAVVVGCHSCVKTWWTAVKGEAPLLDDLAWRAAMTRRGYQAADALIAPTHAFAEMTHSAYDLSARPYTVRNGRDPAPMPANAAEGADLVVFTAGRLWDTGKDVATLDRAAGRLAMSPVSVVAAGDTRGPHDDHLVLNHVQSFGRLDEAEVLRRLSQQPIFVSPALYEPFGLAVLEAAQAGCALVLSDIATFRELWEEAAVFFPRGDDTALAAAIQALGDNPDRRRALGKAARARGADYTAAAMATGVLDIYRDVLDHRRAGNAA